MLNRWGIPVVSGVTRLVALGLIWYYTAKRNSLRLMLLFTLPDLAFATAFFYYAAKLRRSRRTK